MINILIPLAGNNLFQNNSEYMYPKPLIEVHGKTILEHVVDDFNQMQRKKHYIFVLNNEECKKYNLDATIELLVESYSIIRLDSPTRGALCTALLAIEHINNDIPLIISRGDQIFKNPICSLIKNFEEYDCAVPVFESVHPRWSYVKTNKNNEVIQTAIKKPISKKAIAGLIYYKHGKDFISSAMNVIRKDAQLNDKFYIASTLNELVLSNKKVFAYPIDRNEYYSFYSPQKIQDFDRRLQK